jgi:UDP-N-acetylmuramyl tripeptide synthase
MPLFLTILVGKILLKLTHFRGSGGSALPGLVAERLDPAIGTKLAMRLKRGSIVITGTNGKTTTSRMLSQILTDDGASLVSNRAGSNLSRGVVSALLEYTNLGGHFAQNEALLEVDEAAMPAVCKMLQPRVIVVLNLFRDQLDRYGELDTTARLIGKGISSTNAKVFLNADDPLVASLGSYAQGRTEFFGMNDLPVKKLETDITADSLNCPVCGRELKYSKSFFGHIGHYACPQGHFDRPQPSTQGRAISLNEDGSEFELQIDDEKIRTSLRLGGAYNVYNAVAAAAIASEHGIALAAISQSLEKVKPAFGRSEVVSVGGKKLRLLLIKNPTGFNQIIHSYLLSKKHQNVLFCINDNFADGRDVSWLWDVAMEEFKPQEHNVSTSGLRASDMALRLKYAGIEKVVYNADLKKALNQFIEQLPFNDTGLVISTYTATREVRQLLGSKGRVLGEAE